jgi:uncharacterized protein YbaR (Trm112 family)
MRLACPHCGNELSLADRACARCGRAIRPWTPLAALAATVRRWVGSATALECPRCRQATPLRAHACRHCGQPLTLGVAVEVTLTPLRERWYRFVDVAGPKTMRRLQWAHASLSLALLWWVLGYTERRHGGDWMAPAALSILYLAMVAFLAAALVPKAALVRVVQGTSWRVKLGLLMNYFTVVLLSQNVIAEWWTRAAMLAGLFVVTWAAALVLWHFFWPAYVTTSNFVMSEGEAEFDPSNPQGRTVKSQKRG